jgi:hypothetical protein
VDKPITVPDYFATIATALGMDPQKVYISNVGRPIAITDKGTPVAELFA